MSGDLAADARARVADLLDAQLSPLGLHAIEALAPRPGDVVLDVGCGAAQSVLQLADKVGPAGKVIGVDISPQLLQLARRRAAGRGEVDFIECDARELALPDRGVDHVFSRFGVMAFRDPVATFANLWRMLKPSGRLAFVCWRSLHENELDFLPLQAAGLERLSDPAPFSFAEPAVIRSTLHAAGFRRITIRAHDTMVTSGTLDAMTTVALTVGPLGRIIREHPDLRAAAAPRVGAALARREGHAAVALNAATWVVTARP